MSVEEEYTQAVLIVDDQADVRMSAAIALGYHHIPSKEAENPEQAMEVLQSEPVGLILLDMNYAQDTTSGKEGLAFLQALKEQGISVPVVVMTGWASVDIAVQAMRSGAADFIEKPWQNVRLVSIVKQQLKTGKLAQENARFSALSQAPAKATLGHSTQMKALLEQCRRAAISDANILLTGENGTGKSMLAEYIHRCSARSEQRFVSVNMGAVPENLFESELFGHKKGAFTDAREERLGRFDIAADGTLFLDEIGTLPSTLQAKMLRVLETGQFEVLGSSHTNVTNARVIAATNSDLPQLIRDGGFRQDLYFRLNTIELHIPPLRERPQDVAILARYFLDKHCQKYQRQVPRLSDSAVTALISHSWEGNVRELSHCLERVVIMSDKPELIAQDLGLQVAVMAEPEKHGILSLEQSEKDAIIKALSHFSGNVMAAAEFLGISKSALYRRIEKFELDLNKLL